MLNHTPGPWWIGPHQQIISAGWSIRIADGSAIAYVLGEKNPELRANAHLIAKAPKLFDFALLISKMTTDCEMGGDMSGDDATETLSCLIERARTLVTRSEEAPA